jgi:hypothetical protein
MAEALLWGLVAGSSLAVGGALALSLPISRLALGLIMAFGAGVLISAVAYDLVDDAVTTSAGSGGVGLGLFAGALTFFVGDAVIDRLGGAERKDSGGAQAAGSAPAIVLGNLAASTHTQRPPQSAGRRVADVRGARPRRGSRRARSIGDDVYLDVEREFAAALARD